jgi:hypothetical protein
LGSFADSIRAFVHFAESSGPADYSISWIQTSFHFQRRRWYDVMCVFGAIGCCQKLSTDSVRWEGLAHIPFTFMTLQRNARADSSDIALDALIVSSTTVSISTLTVGFVLCFLALRMRTLDIKQVSRYLSHQTGRQKSRLCKLYQIAHILEAAGVITRSEVAGEIVIVEKFFAPVDLTDPAKSPFAIESLLNRARPGEEQTLQTRRNGFWAKGGASRLQE